MRLILKALQYIGFMAFMIGGAAMDSESLIIPCILTFVGLGLTYLGWRIEENEFTDFSQT